MPNAQCPVRVLIITPQRFTNFFVETGNTIFQGGH
jgi:hypothetical protein